MRNFREIDLGIGIGGNVLYIADMKRKHKHTERQALSMAANKEWIE